MISPIIELSAFSVMHTSYSPLLLHGDFKFHWRLFYPTARLVSDQRVAHAITLQS